MEGSDTFRNISLCTQNNLAEDIRRPQGQVAFFFPGFTTSKASPADLHTHQPPNPSWDRACIYRSYRETEASSTPCFTHFVFKERHKTKTSVENHRLI